MVNQEDENECDMVNQEDENECDMVNQEKMKHARQKE